MPQRSTRLAFCLPDQRVAERILSTAEHDITPQRDIDPPLAAVGPPANTA